MGQSLWGALWPQPRGQMGCMLPSHSRNQPEDPRMTWSPGTRLRELLGSTRWGAPYLVGVEQRR